MRRISLWVLSTLSTLVLLFGYSTSTSGPAATSTPPSIGAGATSGSSAASSGSGSKTSGNGGAGPTTVTGSVASTRWGPVQVELVLDAGKLTRVNVVQYPTENSTDQQINNYALPILTQETIDAQSAHIDMVSGATFTSEGYVQSLQSALDQAGL